MIDANPASDYTRRRFRIPRSLEQFERLANKFGLKIPQKRLDRLRQLRDSGRIQSKDLPAKLIREFPGEFARLTLSAIRRACEKKS